MDKKVFWNRRSGFDRRLSYGGTDINRRTVERRDAPNNDFLLILGNNGLDSFELLAIVPIISLLTAMMVGSYIGG
ncbi:MAG: hypothetical protein ACJAYG_000784 [Oceanicoccus sp.]|jgi:hypothetical protein